ncbi:MAG: hypothetical protein ACI9U2_001233 [Bradymonadia bacterium]|jgi:hypothetical protein
MRLLPLIHWTGLACLVSASLAACVPPDEASDAPANAQPEAAEARAKIGADCRCPDAECDADAEVCVCEASGGQGPCVDGLTCLGSPASGECTRPCEADADCSDGFACVDLQVGSTVTRQWCFSTQ